MGLVPGLNSWSKANQPDAGGTASVSIAANAQGIRATAGVPIPRPDADQLERVLSPARATMPRGVWDAKWPPVARSVDGSGAAGITGA